jgi:hypothetical protein
MARKECAKAIAHLDGLDRAILRELKKLRGGRKDTEQGTEGSVLPTLPARDGER